MNKKAIAQQRLQEMANFVVSSRSRFARNSIFNSNNHSTFLAKHQTQMKTKTFNSITSVAMTLTLTAAMLSFAGIAITGFYPRI